MLSFSWIQLVCDMLGCYTDATRPNHYSCGGCCQCGSQKCLLFHFSFRLEGPRCCTEQTGRVMCCSSPGARGFAPARRCLVLREGLARQASAAAGPRVCPEGRAAATCPQQAATRCPGQARLVPGPLFEWRGRARGQR